MINLALPCSVYGKKSDKGVQVTGSAIGIALITALESLQANEYLLSSRQNTLRKNMQLKHVKVCMAKR